MNRDCGVIAIGDHDVAISLRHPWGQHSDHRRYFQCTVVFGSESSCDENSVNLVFSRTRLVQRRSRTFSKSVRLSLLPAPLKTFSESCKHGLDMTEYARVTASIWFTVVNPGGGLLGRPGGEVKGVEATVGAAPFLAFSIGLSRGTVFTQRVTTKPRHWYGGPHPKNVSVASR